VIRSLKLDPIDFNEDKFFDFTFAISKEAHSFFKFISFQILLHDVEDKAVFFELEARSADSF
jgi:hypothetical protein